MPLRIQPGIGPRHAYDFDPDPGHPVVRLFPEIRFGPGVPPSLTCWVCDDGENVDTVEVFNRGHSHFLDESRLFNDDCDICKRRKAFRYDDFFGYLCTTCEIKYPLRFKARGVNPWSGKVNP